MVREHIRNINTDGNMYLAPQNEDNWVIDEQDAYSPTGGVVMSYNESPVILKGGVSKTGRSFGGIGGKIGGAIGTVVAIGLELLPIAAQIYAAMNSVSGNVELIKPQFNNKIKQLDTQIAHMKQHIDSSVDRLINTNNKLEYSKLYKSLAKDYSAYQYSKNFVNTLKAHANSGNYGAVAEELKNYTQNWDKNGNLFYTNQSNQPVNMRVPASTYLKNQAKALGGNMKNWINETNPDTEAYKQKLYLSAVAASAPMSLGAVTTARIGQALTPFIGARLGQLTAQGISGGLASGAASGFSRGMIYNQNPLITAFHDAGTFGAFGGLFGFGIGSIEKIIAQCQIYSSPLKEALLNAYIRNYVAGLDNVIGELRNIRAMRAGTSQWGNNRVKLYDTKPLKYTSKYVRLNGQTYKEIWLPENEYAHIHSEVTTYAQQNKLKNCIIKKTIHHEGQYNRYHAVINKYGLPRFIKKEKI